MEVVLEIIKAGMLTSIQDLGRRGLNYYAIAGSGAMDPYSAKIANLLLRKKETDPVIECTLTAPTILFHESTEIAISGADFYWRINGLNVAVDQKLKVNKGDVLSGKQAVKNMRAYIAVLGNLKIEPVFASHATQVNAGLGGYEGRQLKKGDLLTWETITQSSQNEFVLNKGPEFDWLDEASKKALFTNQYTISSDSNRMGIRLKGRSLSINKEALLKSVPLLPGFIQLPPSGLPIIVLQDGQTTGGYPRIGYIKKEALGRLNQVRIGDKICFIEVK